MINKNDVLIEICHRHLKFQPITNGSFYLSHPLNNKLTTLRLMLKLGLYVAVIPRMSGPQCAMHLASSGK